MNELQIHRAARILKQVFEAEWQTIAGMLGTEGLRPVYSGCTRIFSIELQSGIKQKTYART